MTLDPATEELRELVHMLDLFTQDLGDRVRQLHRLVDLGIPEFTRHVRTLDSELATSILREARTTAAAAIALFPPRRGTASASGRRVRLAGAW